MPLYEYECAQDGRFELIRKFSDPPLRACPTCGQPVEKLVAAPAIQFKGSGWYVTDYARKTGADAKANGDGQGGGDGKAKADSATGGASEAKPKESSASADAKSSPPQTSTKKAATPSGSGSTES